jgi:2-C-methyl-D-erythritol 4-phosphate cytidylyltransferase
MDCAAIIVGAGSSQRMGFDKLTADLNGVSVLQRSLDAFLSSGFFREIVVVTTSDRFASLKIGTEVPVHLVAGGNERYLSVIEGLDALVSSPPYVAIHDGARPLVEKNQIAQCLEAVRIHGAVSLARRATETLKKGNEHGFTRGSVPRENLWIMETPQVFQTDMLQRAYAGILKEKLSVTDDVSAVESIGFPTKLIENTQPNPKITVEGDLITAAAILRARA